MSVVTKHMDADVAAVSKQATATIADLQQRIDYTSQDLNAILLHVDIVAGRLERASRAQEQVSQKTLAILDHTDVVLTQVAKSTNDISSHTVQALDSIPPALDQVSKTAADPNIAKSLANIEQATAQTTVAMKNVSATTDDVKQIADHYKQEITKPVSFVKRMAGYALTGLKAVLLFQ